MRRAVFPVCIMLIAGTALAHSGATGIVKERMDMMKDLGATMKVLVSQSKAHTVERARIIGARQTIVDHADHLVDMFPAGSNAAPSEAAPAIWTERERFDRMFSDMRATALNLSTGPDAKPLSEQVADITATCKACHQAFRIKK